MKPGEPQSTFIPVVVREVVLLCLGVGTAIYADYTHDHSAVVYGFSLLVLGIIPFSVVDRYLTLRFGGGTGGPSAPPPPPIDEHRDA